MKDRANKIFGLAFFLVLCVAIVYLIANAKAIENDVYRSILLEGNHLLSSEEYLDYSELNDSSKYDRLTLAEVKKRFLENPYVDVLEVRFDGISSIVVELEEKKPKALVLNNGKLDLITESGELLPVLNKNLVKDLPIISNAVRTGKNSNSALTYKSAFRIIDAVRIIDENMFDKLAEINLRNGGDIVLMFSGLPYPLIFGKGNEARKILALNNIWSGLLKDKKSNQEIEYIDLRYKGKIFIGKRKSAEING